MLINGKTLLRYAPIKDMIPEKRKAHGVSYGLSEVGYDLRIKQSVEWFPPDFEMAMATRNPKYWLGYTVVTDPEGNKTLSLGRTALASSIEEFDMPEMLWGELRNKSTWAREFVDAAQGTDMEPGWKGNLTIEIIFNGIEKKVIHAGSGILKAVFHPIIEAASYDGKYQNQADMPVPAIYQ